MSAGVHICDQSQPMHLRLIRALEGTLPTETRDVKDMQSADMHSIFAFLAGAGGSCMPARTHPPVNTLMAVCLACTMLLILLLTWPVC